MLNTTLNKIKDRIALCERDVSVLFGFYADKGINLNNLQIYLDTICETKADNLIKTYMHELETTSLKTELIKYLNSIDAKDKHNGKRFANTLYTKLLNLEQEKNLHIEDNKKTI